MATFLDSGFGLAIWKLVWTLLFIGAMVVLTKSAGNSWKKTGSWLSILDELIMAGVAIALIVIIFMTTPTTMFTPIINVLKWIIGLLTDLARTIGIPL